MQYQVTPSAGYHVSTTPPEDTDLSQNFTHQERFGRKESPLTDFSL